MHPRVLAFALRTPICLSALAKPTLRPHSTFSSRPVMTSVESYGLEGDMRIFNDNVFDYIELSPLMCKIVDTPQFQRLRYIKQMGMAYFVWPGASHNRFEHCLGTAHLSGLMVDHLRKQQPELGISARDLACVKIAGLCHDLGHGPFSHIWDNQFMPLAQPDGGWTHEIQSEIMLDALIAENSVPLSSADVAFVKDLIAGEVKHTKGHSPPEKTFLFEIVANKRNSLDVDKWDYIARDLLATGDRGDWGALRLIHSSRVIDGQICYNFRDVHTVFNLYQTRYKMYGIYNHKTRKALECMVVDALLAADPHMGLSLRAGNHRAYLHLTDDILLEIERSDDARLKDAQAILRRIRVRDLYGLIDTIHLPYSARPQIQTIFTAENIVKEVRILGHPLGNELLVNHIYMDITPLHWGMKDKNPFDTIKFYRGKENSREAFHLGTRDKTLIFPQVFAEVMVRAYTKDKKYTELIRAAFKTLVDRSLHDLSP